MKTKTAINPGGSGKINPAGINRAKINPINPINKGSAMKKALKKAIALIITAQAVRSLSALDLGNGLILGGGVKTGLEIKNADYAGRLEGVGHSQEYPMTLYFASRDNEVYNGEGWLNFSYSGSEGGFGYGLGLGAWAHGTLKNYEDPIHLGDHYLRLSLAEGRFQILVQRF
jgi:hypothetical protein